MKVPLARPWFGDGELDNLGRVLESGWLTQGPWVERFEAMVAERLGVAHALACTSATAALGMAIHDLSLPVGSEILVPSFTFPAPINAILSEGCRPAFVDVDRRTYNVDIADLPRAVNSRTKAILIVHQFGLMADVERIAAFASSRGLAIIEDGACALGSMRDGAPIGRHGRFTALSFHPRKILTTGEGGVLATDDGAAAERLRAYRSQGAVVSDIARHRAGSAPIPRFLTPGFNFRMSDLHAAVGCAQMERLDLILERRRSIGARYVERLVGLSAIRPPASPPGCEPTYQTFCCTLDEDAPISRDRLVAGLRAAGIASAQGAVAAHAEPAYLAHATRELPGTDFLRRQSFLLPLYPQMTDAEVDYVLEQVEPVLGGAHREPHP